MKADILTLLIAIIGSSALTSAITFWFSRRKTDAEAKKTEAETDVSMAGELRRNVDWMMEKIQGLTEQNTRCASELSAMRADNEEKSRVIATLRRDASAVRGEIETMRSRLNELQAHVDTLTNEH